MTNTSCEYFLTQVVKLKVKIDLCASSSSCLKTRKLIVNDRNLRKKKKLNSWRRCLLRDEKADASNNLRLV